MPEAIHPELQAAIDLGKAAGTTMWCAIEKHHACKGRMFDEQWQIHPCQCPCHAVEDPDGDD